MSWNLSRGRWGLASVVAGLLLGACAHASPRERLTRYTAALRAHDEAAVRRQSDAQSRELWEKTPGPMNADWAAVASTLDRKVVRIEEHAYLHLDGGKTVELVREGGHWRIAAGGLDFARADTPPAALATFMAAYDAGRLGVLRSLIPHRFLSTYADDRALTEHLEAMADRIEAARPALTVSRAEVRGDYARIPYGAGRSVELVMEDGIWRILDLE